MMDRLIAWWHISVLGHQQSLVHMGSNPRAVRQTLYCRCECGKAFKWEQTGSVDV